MEKGRCPCSLHRRGRKGPLRPWDASLTGRRGASFSDTQEASGSSSPVFWALTGGTWPGLGPGALRAGPLGT